MWSRRLVTPARSPTPSPSASARSAGTPGTRPPTATSCSRPRSWPKSCSRSAESCSGAAQSCSRSAQPQPCGPAVRPVTGVRDGHGPSGRLVLRAVVSNGPRGRLLGRGGGRGRGRRRGGAAAASPDRPPQRQSDQREHEGERQDSADDGEQHHERGGERLPAALEAGEEPRAGSSAMTPRSVVRLTWMGERAIWSLSAGCDSSASRSAWRLLSSARHDDLGDVGRPGHQRADAVDAGAHGLDAALGVDVWSWTFWLLLSRRMTVPTLLSFVDHAVERLEGTEIVISPYVVAVSLRGVVERDHVTGAAADVLAEDDSLVGRADGAEHRRGAGDALDREREPAAPRIMCSRHRGQAGRVDRAVGLAGFRRVPQRPLWVLRRSHARPTRPGRGPSPRQARRRRWSLPHRCRRQQHGGGGAAASSAASLGNGCSGSWRPPALRQDVASASVMGVTRLAFPPPVSKRSRSLSEWGP